MIYQIQNKKDPMISEMYKKAMKELDEFFKLNWIENTPLLIVVPDRATIDKLKQEKTENWLVAWAEYYNSIKIYILGPSNYEKYSCHKYSEKEYYGLIKHELAHCFTAVLSNYSYKPIWLLEGISIFLSGQNETQAVPQKFTTFLDSYDSLETNVYEESGFVVELLIKKYGKQKIIKLLKTLGIDKNQKEFNDSFKRIYGFNLNDINKNLL